jgi:HSP20 family protein
LKKGILPLSGKRTINNTEVTSMALTRYEPFELLNRLSGEVNSLMRGQGHGNASDATMSVASWIPAADIREENDRFVIHADVPGVDPKAIDVTLENGMLTIKGERSNETNTESNGYRYVERTQGSFMRRFSVPNTVDTAKVQAKALNGVLQIIVPKAEAAQPRRITVSS